MGKLWLVAKQEYVGRVRQRSFLVGTLSILAIIAVIMGITAIIVIGGRDDRPLGYVDHAGVFAAQPAPAADGPELRAFADETAARQALAAGVIQAFYLLPEDYLSRHEVALVYGKEQPGERVRGAFDDALRTALAARALAGRTLAATAPAGVRQRLVEGSAGDVALSGWPPPDRPIEHRRCAAAVSGWVPVHHGHSVVFRLPVAGADRGEGEPHG